MSQQPYEATPMPPPGDFRAGPANISSPSGPGSAASQGRGCVYIGARVLAGILAGVFVLAMPTALFLFNMQRIALDPDTYKQALNRVDFYNQLPTLMAGTISDSVAKDPANNPALARLSRTDVQAIISALITKEWAQEQTESGIDQLFAWLDTDKPTLSIVISMKGIKQQLTGPAGTSAALKVVSSWPACTDTQLLTATAAVASGNMNQLPYCRPPEELMPAVTPYFGEVAAQGATTIPETIDLAAPNGVPSKIDAANDPRPTLRLYKTIALLSLILPALLLLGIALLAVRSWRSIAGWLGVPLLIAGILGGLVALLMLPLRDMLTQSMATGSSPLAASFQDVVFGVFGYVFQAAGLWIGGESAVVGGGGLILLVAGLLLGRSQTPPGYLIGSQADGYSPR